MWLTKGFEVGLGVRIKKILCSADYYEIYSTTNNTKTLLVTENLHELWIKDKLIDDALFQIIKVNENNYYFLNGNNDYIISNVKSGYAMCNKSESMAFVDAYIKTRKKTDISLFEAIYLEEFSLLLPTYTNDKTDDKTMLGTWLAGGVIISTDNFNRLNSLVAFLSPKDLMDTIKSAGFSVLESGVYLTKHKSLEDIDEEGKRESIFNKATIRSGKFSLVGRPSLENFINEHIVDILQNEEKYKKMGINFPSAVILHGPPGCGKTFAVHKLVEFLDLPCYEINSSAVASPFIHDTSKKVSEVFDKAIENAPSIIVIDEMEAYLADRGVGASSGMHHVEEVAEFLRRIPEAIHNRVLVIAMTNMIDMIDPAILRRGRFDHIIEVGMPAKDEVEMLLNSLFGKLPTAEVLDLSNIIKNLTGRPLSDVTFVVREAARIAVKNDIEKIDIKCIEEAMLRLSKSNGVSKKIGF